ncbi:MAG: DNA mismatch repair endonuclease MutL, partial [Opitutales bacterium]
MSSIRLLSDRVANQIAAGEVVERPAAVVKELIENSLDAGAERIEIEYRNGGKAYLRVEDDGHGMRPDEALLSLERHATSKIREADDLLTITSFGFRGEALPSIASVSNFVMRTRSQGEESGVEILVNGGKLIHQKDCGMPVGTRIEVSRLFNSVPARRKFLRTDATEASHVCRLARLYAMAHPETAFTLMENGRTIFRSPTCKGLRERLGEIFGGGFTEDLLEVQAEMDNFSLSGLMGKPGVGRSTKQEMIFMVN